MRRRSLLASLVVLVVLASVSRAQEAGAPVSRSWTAPPFWAPLPRARENAIARADANTDRVREPFQTQTDLTGPLPFVAVAPCRMLDTRVTGGPIASGTTRDVMLTGTPCGIPSSAAAVSANFVVFNITGTSSNGVLTVFPTGSPSTSQALLNWSPSSGQIDNAAVVPLGTGGSISLQPNQGAGSIDMVIDVNGYYAGSVVTSVAPGAGITASPSTGAVTVGIANGGVDTTQLANGAVTAPKLNANVFSGTGSATTAARSDHNHDLFYWKSTGNAGTTGANFLGTTDNQAFEIHVNGVRALRIEPTGFTPNIIGGYSGNSVNPPFAGATIVGGGLPGNVNTVTNGNGTIVGGYGNTADQGGFVGGGSGNQALGVNSTIGGGGANLAGGAGSTIPGGDSNTANGNTSFAAGYNAKAVDFGAFVWGDFSILSPVTSTGPNQFIVRAWGGARFLRETTTHTATSAGLQAEHAGSLGEAAWLYTSSSSNPAAVIKLLKNPAGTNNFLNCENFGVATKCHITSAGTFVAGSDFAESLPARGEKRGYSPGDVLVASREAPGGVEKSSRRYDSAVVGVYSTRPGVLGADKDGDTRIDADEIPVAITGIVPTKVTNENGPIGPGDLLTTSSMPGYAMKAKPVLLNGVELYAPGTLVGKALTPLTGDRGVIKILVLLR